MSYSTTLTPPLGSDPPDSQALVPEEIVTVPASAVVGAIVGVVGFVTD